MSLSPSRWVAEFLATAFLLAIIVGSGIMAQRLSGGHTGLALLANALATGAGLVVLIHVFGPVSGARMNPVVSLVAWRRGEQSWPATLVECLVQSAGALTGILLAHAMFDLPLLQISTNPRMGTGQWIAEVVATFGLLLTIFGCATRHPAATPFVVGLYITSAYWFTASTSFANPAVTLARGFTDSFAGIAPSDILPFVLAQGLGACLALWVRPLLWPEATSRTGEA